jgi:hypothetical protein
MLPELAANKNVALAGPVPEVYGAGVDFSTGIAAGSVDADFSTGIAAGSVDAVKANAFVSFLTDPKAASVWKTNGLEVPGAH